VQLLPQETRLFDMPAGVAMPAGVVDSAATSGRHIEWF
jgi:hypothetical protein